jgi:hypothetical protein
LAINEKGLAWKLPWPYGGPVLNIFLEGLMKTKE